VAAATAALALPLLLPLLLLAALLLMPLPLLLLIWKVLGSAAPQLTVASSRFVIKAVTC
jgi:hypothetical protein